MPRGTALLGQGNCVDSSNERYISLEIEASEFKDGFSAQLCLEKCISLSSITQLQFRAFETSDIEWSPCACLIDHDPDDAYGSKFTEELRRENGFDIEYSIGRQGVGPVSSVISPDYGNPFCYAVENDVSIRSWINSSQQPPIYFQTNSLARHHFLALRHTIRRQ